LIFHLEDENEFRKRVEEAKEHRLYAEKIMRYYYLIENTKIPQYDMSDEQKTKISFDINSFKSESNLIGKKFRDPMEFLYREARDRYGIPKSLITPRMSPPNAVEDIHRDILIRKYNL
jgi:hypothetical protein